MNQKPLKSKLSSPKEQQIDISKKMMSNINDSLNQDKSFKQRRGAETKIDKIKKCSLIRRSLTDTDSEEKIKEDIWYQREMEIRKCFSKIPLQKRNTIDSLTIVCIVAMLFVWAFQLAPNQFYKPVVKD